MSLLASPWPSAPWDVLAIIAAAGVFLAYPAFVLRKYVRIMVELMDDHAHLPDNGGSDSGVKAGEEVSFGAADGHGLRGVLLRGRTEPAGDGAEVPRGVVIFAHEYGSDRSSCQRYCRSLLDAGFEVLAFDFRGHGLSPGEAGYRPRQWPSDRESSDVRGAVAYAESRLRAAGRPISIGVFGLSRGASAAILAAEQCGSVRAIVADGAYSSDLVMEYFMRRFATIFAKIRVVAANHPPVFWRFLRWLHFRECERRFECRFPSVRKALSRLGRRPILLIHGEKDSYVPFAHCQALYDLATGPKSVWIVPGATHNQSVNVAAQEYARRVVDFFEAHLIESPLPVPLSPRRSGERLEVSAAEGLPAPPARGGVLVGASGHA